MIGHGCFCCRSNIPFKISKSQSAQLDFYWNNEYGLKAKNTGDAIALTGFTSYTVFKGTKYMVKEMRFHSKSQTEVKGKPAVMDCEVIHTSAAGPPFKPFILILQFEKSQYNNAAIQQLPWKRLGKVNSKINSVNPVDLDYLLPKTWAFYHYIGTLRGSGSNAACAKNVPYAVMHYKGTITAKQLALFPASAKYKSTLRTKKVAGVMYNKFYFAAMHKPRHCSVGQWQAWGGCSKKCGGTAPEPPSPEASADVDSLGEGGKCRIPSSHLGHPLLLPMLKCPPPTVVLTTS